MNNKFFFAVITASVIAFFGGWLIFGVIFSNYYSGNINEAARFLTKDPPAIWSLALGNIAWATLITYVLQKTGSSTFLKGFVTGLWVSLLICIVFDLSIYAFFDIYKIGFIAIDIILSSLFWAIIGGIAGAVLGSNMKEVTNVKVS